MFRTTVVSGAVLLVLWAPARADNAPVVVDTAFVEQAVARGSIVWDVRSEEEFKRGHIPGAVNMDDVLVELREASTEDYIPVPQLEKKIGDAGIDLDQEVVVYGAKAGPSAYFAQLTLRYLGAYKVSVYHGGIDDWRAAGKQVSTQTSPRPAVTAKARLRPEMLISTREVIGRLDNPDVQILDVRTAREFNGEDIRALRGGHIPGAVNIPYEANWVDPDTPRKLARKQVGNKDGMNLKSVDDLRKLYGGLDPDKETIVYCQSGNRATETYGMLQMLGFKHVKLYDTSWLGYGNTFDAPVENVTYFNVARVNGTLNQLQGRIDALEAEIEQLKAQLPKKP
jgi:thiosulfate/3-mercaptopyruvate sulfurtransferase